MKMKFLRTIAHRIILSSMEGQMCLASRRMPWSTALNEYHLRVTMHRRFVRKHLVHAELCLCAYAYTYIVFMYAHKYQLPTLHASCVQRSCARLV